MLSRFSEFRLGFNVAGLDMSGKRQGAHSVSSTMRPLAGIWMEKMLDHFSQLFADAWIEGWHEIRTPGFPSWDTNVAGLDVSGKRQGAHSV
ncbi:uncharacterized protein LOC124318172 isoform X2 [Daphnia pulicaria]|uniref:uncharacterized protein LOC124318172 isoform X2 n=1 Tax=Daphnia pulicaria TaxID=35523 RepID=UPI001EE9F313|nr:uncharacterized protein LOC124318172 isoform X2 [Daphnia pulicaria]